MKIPRQAYTLEFKQGAVQRVKGGELVSKVAKELGLIEQTLRNWVKAADQGELKSKVKAVTAEEMEVSRLRAENARLKQELAIIKNVWSAPDLQASIIFEQKGVCINVSGLLVQRVAAGLDGIRAHRAP